MKSGLAALLCASAILPLQPSTPAFPFEGTWIAVDRNTRTITGAVVSRTGDAWALEMTGACQPVDCKLPALSLTPIANRTDSSRFDRAQAVEELAGVRRVTTLRLDGDILTIEISAVARNDAARPAARDSTRLIRRPAAPLVPKTARSGVEAAVQAAYAREFGEAIEHPAFYNDDPRAHQCDGEGHLTTTAYFRTSSTTSTLLVMYMSRDGQTFSGRSSGEYLTPAGKIRVLVVLVRYAETFGADGLSMWVQAQRQINAEHAAFAKRRGFRAPIVVFENMNLLVEPAEIDRLDSPASVRAAATRHGLRTDDYQIVMLVDLNPASQGGGLSVLPERFIFVRNFAGWRTPLDAAAWRDVARAAYHHEMAHHWGWPPSHDWAGSCEHDTPSYSPFVVPPVLFGWEDLHGGHVPEILRK